MEIITLFFNAIVDLSLDLAPFILFGLLFAGLLHELVPETFVTKHLGADSLGSVVKATLFGIPLPVCSCGVVPLAASIKKSGASNGAVLSFLISTPITGVDSILATFGMFGWFFTLYRVVTSIILAMIAGIASNLFAAPQTAPIEEEAPKASCCSGTSCCGTAAPKKKFSLLKAFDYGFVTLFKDIAKPLLYGILIGALITVAVPENLSQYLTAHAWLSYLLVVAIAVPMYVCATASLPIAAGLILAGVSPGAAFVFLTAGPATNTVTIGVVKKMLGTKVLVIYLTSIALGSVAFGVVLDWFFTDLTLTMQTMLHAHEEATLTAILSAVAMWMMLAYFLIVSKFMKKKSSCCNS